MTFILNWEDEPDAGATLNNQPDEFSISVQTPDEVIKESNQGSAGTVTLQIKTLEGHGVPKKDPYYNGTGEYVVTIQCHDCGDHEPTIPDPFNLRTQSDDGNDWVLEVKYQYYAKIEE